MKTRLYFLLHDIPHTNQVVDALLVHRIDIHHLHVIAKEGTPLGRLPEASLFQKSDLRHSLGVGGLVGMWMGVGTGLAFHIALGIPIGGLMVLTMLVGMILGAWFSTMVGLLSANTDLKPYMPAVEAGKVLLMADVDMFQVEEIKSAVMQIDAAAEMVG